MIAVFCIRVVAAGGLLAIAGCTQLPLSVQATKDEVPPVRDLPECGVSVRFTEAPVRISPNEAGAIAKGFGEYAKWDVSGWQLSKFRHREISVCACRDYPLTAAELEENKTIIGVVRSYPIAGIGFAVQIERTNSPEEKTRIAIVRLTGADRCMVVQLVGSPNPDSVAASFFSSLTIVSGHKGSRFTPSDTPSIRHQHDNLTSGDVITTNTVKGGAIGAASRGTPYGGSPADNKKAFEEGEAELKEFHRKNRSTQESEIGENGQNNPIAERLRQLDQLLRDQLITREEYNARRKSILDSL